jgi:hypothetical protein
VGNVLAVENCDIRKDREECLVTDEDTVTQKTRYVLHTRTYNVCVYIYMCVCLYIYMCIYIYIYIYIYASIPIRSVSSHRQ